MQPTLCWLVLAAFGSASAVNLLHSVQLDPAVVVHWTPEDEANSITIRVEARTRGWAAVGFSPSGGMAGADIVMGWVKDGQAHVQDMYAVGNTVPLRDDSSDVQLLEGYENATHTVFTFRRPLRPCDSKHDIELGMDTTRLIWALHEADPATGGSPSYHGSRRGVRSVSLDGSGSFQFPTESQSESFIVRNEDTQILDENTHYHCEIHKMPDFGQKVHFTGYRVRLDPATAPYVHHIIMYTCSLPPKAHGFFDDYAANHPGTKCYSRNMPPSWSLCRSIMIAWGIGGEGDMLPENIGMPLGEEDGGGTYFMMETHYDNPQALSGLRDSSGLELFYTRTLRPVEAGLFSAGQLVTSTQLIPPGQRRFVTGGVCPEHCTQKHLPSKGVQVHSVVLHGHLAARAIRVRHIRAGRELPPLAADNYYDFNYQQSRRVDSSVRIMPGDTLLVECDYDTQDRQNLTMGGFSTINEMCIAFLTYYPRSTLSGCRSTAQIGDFLQAMDIREVSVGGRTMPPEIGVGAWTEARYRKEAESVNRTLNGGIAVDVNRRPGKSNDQLQRGRDSWFNLAELSSMAVSVEGDTPSVSLYEYLTKLHWDEPASQRLQHVSNGGRLFYRCASNAHHELSDYKNIHSGPYPYPEFAPWVAGENAECAEKARASAATHARLGAAAVLLTVSALRLFA